MIKNLMLKLITNTDSLSTYKTGLLQAKAYRSLKQITSKALLPYKLSPLEWALLGLLFDSRDGFKLVEIAELLGVESPFVTVLIDGLETKELVRRTVKAEDKRAKMITLTQKGIDLIPVIEKDLLTQTKVLLKGTRMNEVLSYIKVLSKIVENSNSLEK